MRTTPLLFAVVLLAACSEEAPPPEAAAPAAPPARQQAAVEKADLAAAEITGSAEEVVNPCDLSGYDMSKMTADQHGELEKACARSKQ